MAVDVTPPVSRNAPYPCGSGKRYEECQGAVGTGSTAVPGPPNGVLARALADRQAGHLERAIAGYDEPLALAAGHFDATRMLGVAHFRRGDCERALELIDKALALRPGDAGAARVHRPNG